VPRDRATVRGMADREGVDVQTLPLTSDTETSSGEADHPPVGIYCASGALLGLAALHAKCRGNGPLYMPGFTAPVLPAVPCGCGCHRKGGAR
jgi:hypothetical protein